MDQHSMPNSIKPIPKPKEKPKPKPSLSIGGCVGAAQVLIGHPFDTAKIMMQHGNHGFNNLPQFKISTYYRGLSSPLIMNSLVNAIFFKVESQSHIWLHTNYPQYVSSSNHLFSGSAAGLVGSLIICPSDNFKNKRQLRSTLPFRFYRGLHGTFIREGCNIGLYFQSYFWLRKYRHPDHLIVSNFVAGGLSGIASWSLYPLDTIKTRLQTTNMGLIKAVTTPGLWRGVQLAWIRAFIVNGVGFSIYELLLRRTFDMP